MTITRETLIYDGPGGPFEGLAVRDRARGRLQPGILLVPNVLGPKQADFSKAEAVAALGYVVLVADIFGRGNRATRADANPGRFMDALNNDRELLRERLAASLNALKGVAGCDAARLAAIGFCFGGKCVLDMARSGQSIAAAVSFHGVYDRPSYANAQPITAKLLVCHGWDDPISPPDALFALAHEMTQAGADWQVHAYGHTGHGFTDKDANMPERGVVHAPAADCRSWIAMIDFLQETFPPTQALT